MIKRKHPTIENITNSIRTDKLTTYSIRTDKLTTYNCADCGEDFEADKYELNYNTDNKPICSDCYDNDYFHCNGCDNLFHKDDEYFSERADACYCSECYHDRFSTCSCCNSEYHQEDVIYYENIDATLCDSCFQDDYYRCEVCEEVEHTDNGEYDKEDGCYYCKECYKEHGHMKYAHPRLMIK